MKKLSYPSKKQKGNDFLIGCMVGGVDYWRFFLASFTIILLMKPKELKYPCSFEERRPVLQEGIVFVPKYYDAHTAFAMPSLDEIFGNSAEVHVEFCSGNGQWIIDKAENNPDVNWIAVEMDFSRVRKIYAKKMNRGLKNLFVVSGKGEPFAEYYLSDGSVDGAYVNFPDPWPKDRHAKHRIIQKPFIERLGKVVKKNGTLTLVTDDVDYAAQMKRIVAEVGAWEPLESPDSAQYGSSWFERLWRGKGKTIFYMRYRQSE